MEKLRPGIAGSIRMAVPFVLALASVGAQNSMRKIRPTPSPVAARIGTAIQWREDLRSALSEAGETGRPVFWYVPTLRGSPMDRKPEIDRYMMAGPFSDPTVIARLNARFIPVREPAARDEFARGLGIVRGRFIEPGFVVLDAEGEAIGSACSSLTTLSPEWFAHVLDQRAMQARATSKAAAGQPAPEALPELPPRELPAEFQVAIGTMAAGNWQRALEQLRALEATDWPAELQAELGYRIGACLHRTRRGDAARAAWAAVARDFPDQNFGFKAAAEAEAIGPFVHGFERVRALPEAMRAALAGGAAVATSTAPTSVYDRAGVRRHSLDFLVEMQRADGGFVDSIYDFGGTDSLPNVHAAVTALAGRALWHAHQAGIEDSSRRRAVLAALAGAIRHTVDPTKLATDDSDEILWARVYRIRFLADLVEAEAALNQLRPVDAEAGADSALRAAPDAAELRAALEREVAALQGLQSGRSGAYYHEYANPFATASALGALRVAENLGAVVDPQGVERALLALLQCRTERGAYTYSQARGVARASVAGAAGRMPRCELALHQWRPDRRAELRAAISAAFEHHDKLEAVRKYDDHASRLGYGGFFFFYDILGRVEALLALPPSPERRAWIERERRDLLAIVEIDGCFVDSHELGRCYGTAVALLALEQLRAAQ